MRVTLTDNLINNNGQDGVNASTLYFSQVEGTWTDNTIESNGRDGIRFTDGDESGPSFNVTLANNTIENNLADGIFYTSVETIPLGGGNGTVDINDNLIKKNGGNGVNVEPTGSAVANINLTDNQIIFNTLNGVRMQADEFAVITTNSSGNTITNNGGDGWSLTTQTGADSHVALGNGFIIATLTDNIISFNGGRGIDILNQWNGEIDADIEGTVNPTTPGNIGNPALDTNIVDSNGLQGILIENAADLSLSQQAPLNYFVESQRRSRPARDGQPDGNQRKRHGGHHTRRRRRNPHQRRHQPVRLCQRFDHQQPLLRQCEHLLRHAVVRLHSPADRHQPLRSVHRGDQRRPSSPIPWPASP